MTTELKEAQRLVAVDAVLAGKAVRFYSGKEGCCCGCRGKYSEPSTLWTNKMVKLLRSAPVESLDFDESYAAVTVGERLYLVYWN